MGKAVWKREQGVCPQLDCLWSGRGRAGGDWGLRTGRHGREDIRKERQRGRPARGGERRGERSIIIGSFHAEPRAEGAFVPLELSSLHVIARERCQCTYDRKRPWTPCPITDPLVFWGATTRRSLAPDAKPFNSLPIHVLPVRTLPSSYYYTPRSFILSP